MSGKGYLIEEIYQSGEYSWPGDWEGRALLAFVCHYRISGKEIPCMHELVKGLPEHTNEDGYFGKTFDGEIVDEQQLSGHSWYLRGLIMYAEAFQSEFALETAKKTVKKLYLPALAHYVKYPLFKRGEGGVSGDRVQSVNGWILSSDVGCAYMCVDGLAHYYSLTKDPEVKVFLDEVIKVFVCTDIVGHGFQTHTSLSCARGILKMYQVTGEDKYLTWALGIVDTYIRHGMTLTYENYNWFGREDSWTEPCAVVDSFILATEFYKITKNEKYRTLARRIWFNGLQFCQRENGGTGPNTCVTKENPVLSVSLYEAPFCCTMRYAEGLLEYTKNEELFVWRENEEESVDEFGRHFVDDKLMVMLGEEKKPIFSCNGIEEAQAKELRIKILF